MKFCGSCGAPATAGDTFCGSCGTALVSAAPLSRPPAAPSLAPAATPAAMPATPTAAEPLVEGTPNWWPGLIVVLALVVIAVIVGGVLVLTSGDDDAATSSSTSIPWAAGSSTATTAGQATTSTLPPTTVTPTTLDPVGAATAELQRLTGADAAVASALVGTFVPQLSAKRVGLEVAGIVFGPVEIVADHEVLRDKYGAIFVDAGAYDFRSDDQPMTGWYLTVVPVGFASREEADQWCTDHGPGPEACFGRLFKPAV